VNSRESQLERPANTVLPLTAFASEGFHSLLPLLILRELVLLKLLHPLFGGIKLGINAAGAVCRSHSPTMTGRNDPAVEP
jgi:hypothetical protein